MKNFDTKKLTENEYNVSFKVSAETVRNLDGSALNHKTNIAMDLIRQKVFECVHFHEQTKDLDLYSTYWPNGFGDFLPEHLKK